MNDYTLSIFTEDQIGLLNRITIIFTRRHLNIKSITASPSEVEGVYRYTIVVNTTEEMAGKVVKQIEKQVEVLKAFYHKEDDVLHQEIALYKMELKSLGDFNLEKVIREFHARVLSVTEQFIVIEKAGQASEIQELFKKLEPFGILEFARSGRVAVTKPMKPLKHYLEELECLTGSL